MITIECPLNSLSFGNVSFNILRELFESKQDICLFPIGEQLDLSAFNATPEFQGWLQEAISQKWQRWDVNNPSLRLWHLMGSEDRKSTKQTLFTFYECSNPTLLEKKIGESQNSLVFSSSYAMDKFKSAGVDSSFVPLGFDKDYHQVDVPRPSGVNFGLMGKFEHRKRTAEIIKLWLKRYGNIKGFTLNLCVTNPFFKPEDMAKVIDQCYEGKHYNNVNVLPYLKTNADVNAYMNMIDIDLGGLSGGEGWNLPSFNATCLGKWSIVLNETAHKDWATSDNSILVESSKTIDSEDGVFFKKGHAFNQGFFYDWEEKDVHDALDIAETKVGQLNTSGVDLSRKLTYKNTATKLLEAVNKPVDA
jgi:hypothetical protein